MIVPTWKLGTEPNTLVHVETGLELSFSCPDGEWRVCGTDASQLSEGFKASACSAWRHHIAHKDDPDDEGDGEGPV